MRKSFLLNSVALMSAAGETGAGIVTPVTATGDKRIADAMKAGADTAEFEAFNEDSESFLQAKVTAAQGPLKILDDLMAEMDEETLLGFPVPGSTVESVKGTNYPSDEIIYYKKNTKTGKNDEKKTSFYKEFTAGTKLGKASLWAQEQIAIAQTAETKSKAAAPYNKMSPEQLDAELKVEKDRFNSLKGLNSNALKLFFVMQGFLSPPIADNIEFKIRRDSEGNLARTTYPVTIKNKKESEFFANLKLSTVLNLKVAEIAANGGTYKAFEDSIQRESDSDSEDTEAKTELEGGVIRTIDQFEAVMAALAHAFEDKNLMAEFMRQINGKEKQRFILEYGETLSHAAAIWEAHVRGQYRQLLDKQSRDANAGADNKTAAA